MATHSFYSTENKRNERQVVLFRPTLLISKPPTKEKRISVLARMPLTGQSNMGAPEWTDSAYTYVAQHHDKVSPNIEFKGYSFTFSADNLFGHDVSTVNGSMRKFEVSEQGDEENPDVVMEFSIRLPFSKNIWEWLGAYAGDPVWVKFVPGVPDEAAGSDDDGPEIDDIGDEEESGEGAASTYEEDEADANSLEESSESRLTVVAGGKSGPKDLAAYHEGVVQQVVKRGRGRPRKNPVDPLTVNTPVAPMDF